MHVAQESPDQPDVIALIAELDAYQDTLYPAEARYALDLASLKQPNVVFAVARDAEGVAIGCGAVVVNEAMGELKRMYVRPGSRRAGAAQKLLHELEAAAAQRGCQELLLETGPYQPEALAFYARQGFARRGAFGSYPDHPLSVFMGRPVAQQVKTPEPPLLEGSCHCGAVRLTLPFAPTVATSCNCSLCRRIGGPWVYFEFGTVKITGHPESTTEYIQGDKTLRTIRCKTCGCVTHWEPTDPQPGAKHGVHLANFDREMIASVRVRRFDGADSWTFLDE